MIDKYSLPEPNRIPVFSNQTQRRLQLTPSHRILTNPSGVHPPVGRYKHLARVRASEFLFLAGQVGLDEHGTIVGLGDAGIQTRQAYKNISAILENAGSSLNDIVQITTYIVGQENLQSYLDARTDLFTEVFPEGIGPPNTLVFIDALFEKEMLVEVAVVAAVP